MKENAIIKIAGAIGVIAFPLIMITQKLADAGNIYIVALYTCYLIPIGAKNGS